ncbi:MAG: hypothetical protein GXP30_15125 [Verrucomicrobia bacterium]|nr:hypothetical protein [Verrucomicrobiota bacterium]
MQETTHLLEILLIAAAIGQLAIAVINLFLVRLLGWQDELDRMSPLLRDVFHVHKYFISIILVIFGVLTLRFAGDLATGNNELGRWLVVGIACFWGIRAVMQWAYYSWDHWKGQPGRLAVHWILTGCYGGCALVYLYAGIRT